MLQAEGLPLASDMRDVPESEDDIARQIDVMRLDLKSVGAPTLAIVTRLRRKKVLVRLTGVGFCVVCEVKVTATASHTSLVVCSLSATSRSWRSRSLMANARSCWSSSCVRDELRASRTAPSDLFLRQLLHLKLLQRLALKADLLRQSSEMMRTPQDMSDIPARTG